MTKISENRYDEYQYRSMPFEESAPGNIAAVAKLFGLAPVAIEKARVLELGCASGGNLIPHAITNPDASFVGIDLSESQITSGQKLLNRLSLENVTLAAMPLEQIDETLGKFDFIIAHGLFSWVPESTQIRIFDVIENHLSETGLAYVSFNTLPGWHLVNYTRDLMNYGARTEKSLADKAKVARQTLKNLLNATDGDEGIHTGLLRSESAILDSKEDFYLIHDHLADDNRPMLLEKFVRMALEKNIYFVSDADIQTMFTDNFSPAIRKFVEVEPDRVSRQQMLDFCLNRRFRKAILSKTPILKEEPAPSSLDGLHFRCQLANHTPFSKSNLFDQSSMKFRTVHGTILQASGKLTKQVIFILASLDGSSLSKETLTQQIKRLSIGQDIGEFEEKLERTLLTLIRKGVVKVKSEPDKFNIKIGAEPEASALAREQSTAGEIVTNLRHQNVKLNRQERFVLPFLNGKKSLEQIAIEITHVSSKKLPANHPIAITASKGEKHLLQELNMMLKGFRKNGLLM